MSCLIYSGICSALKFSPKKSRIIIIIIIIKTTTTTTTTTKATTITTTTTTLSYSMSVELSPHLLYLFLQKVVTLDLALQRASIVKGYDDTSAEQEQE